MKPAQIPFVRLFIPFALGIIASIYFPSHFAIVFATLIFCIALILWNLYEDRTSLLYPLRWVSGVLSALFLFGAGYSVLLLHTPSQNKSDISNHFPAETDTLLVRIISIPQEKDKTVKATVEMMGIMDSGKCISTAGKALFYFHKDSVSEQLAYGDKLLLTAHLKEIEPPSNPDEFDYRAFLHNKGIYYESFVRLSSNSFVKNNSPNFIMQFANESRKKLVTLLNKCIGGEQAHLASAILLGYREDLSRGVVQTFVDSGTVHVICVAGLHVGIIFLVLNFILSFFGNRLRWIQTLSIIILLWLYALLTGLATPVLRATVMFSFLTLGIQFRKYSNPVNTLAASAFLLLICNPFSIADSGFQLSYLSVLGILLIYKPLSSMFTVGNSVLRKIWELFCVSASAQLAIFPLSFFYFHQFPNYFLFTNILVVPLLSVVIFAGIFFFLTSWIPYVATATAWLLKSSLSLMGYIVTAASRLPWSVSKGISVSAAETIILYLFLISVFIFFLNKKQKAVFWALSFLVLFFCLRVWSDIENSKQQIFIVYNIPAKPACSFISGKKSVTAFSKIDSNDVSYHLQYNRWALGLKENKTVISDTDALMLSGRLLLHHQFAQFDTCKYAFVSSDSALPDKKISVQNVIVSGKYQSGMMEIKNAFNFDTLIFDSSVPLRKLKLWKASCKELRMAYYDVQEKGAYIRKI